jgi:pentatricopeptide repeat protein
MVFHAASREAQPSLDLLSAILHDKKGKSLALPDFLFCVDKLGNNPETLEKLENAWEQMRNEGVKFQPRVAYTFIRSVTRRGGEGGVEKYVQWLKEANVRDMAGMNNLLVANAAHKGDYDTVNKLMEREKKTVIMYNSIIDAEMKRKNHKKAVESFNQMEEEGIQPHVSTFHILLNGFAQLGMLESVQFWMEEMTKYKLEPDVRIYSSLIGAAKLHRNHGLVEKWLKEMKEKGIPPNVVTYTRLLSATSRQGNKVEFERWLAEMTGAGVEMAEITFNTIVQHYANIGDEQKMQEWQAKMRENGWKLSVSAYRTFRDDAQKRGYKEKEVIQKELQKHPRQPSLQLGDKNTEQSTSSTIGRGKEEQKTGTEEPRETEGTQGTEEIKETEGTKGIDETRETDERNRGKQIR